jgi:hypothetical protein
VHSQVHTPLGQRLLNLLGKHPLRTDLRKGYLLQPVASSLDDLDLDFVTGPAKARSNMVGLPECELGSTASDAQLHN